MVPGQVVQIVSLPDALKSVPRPVHLEAEVIRQNEDGSTRVRTAQGDIDIVVKGRQPQAGQRMELEIPPGSPPQKAVTRPASQAPAQPTPQSPPPPQDGEVPQLPPPLPQTPVTQKPPVQGGQPQSQTPPVTTMPAPRPATPMAADAIKSAAGSIQDKVLITQQTIGAGTGAGQPATQAIPSPNIIGQNQLMTQQFPIFKAGDIMQLAAGKTVNLIPVAAAVPDGTGKPIIADGLISSSQITQKPQSANLVASLLQAVKTAMPQTVTNAVATLVTKPSVIPDGAGITPKPSHGMATPVATGTNIALPDGTALTMPVLEAKIIQIKSPSGQIQILTPDADNPDTAQSIGTSKPAPVTVNVQSVTSQKLPVIAIPVNAMPNAPLQNFVIPVQSPMIDTGAQITFVPQMPQTVPPAQIAALPPAWRALLPLMQPSPLWPVMDDLFQTFAGTTPQAAQILGRIIPSPANAANMGPAMMLFAAAMKSGDLQGWIGDRKLGMMQKLGKADLVSRLAGETSALTQNSDAPATEWKSLPIPMLWQNEVSKVMFHVRQEPRDDNDPNGEAGTRFVFDLNLTRMGEVQLDGMVRGNRLDLIVRTKENISYPMQEAMKKAYADALVGTEIYGELGFQGDIKAWMHVSAVSKNMQIDL